MQPVLPLRLKSLSTLFMCPFLASCLCKKAPVRQQNLLVYIQLYNWQANLLAFQGVHLTVLFICSKEGPCIRPLLLLLLFLLQLGTEMSKWRKKPAVVVFGCGGADNCWTEVEFIRLQQRVRGLLLSPVTSVWLISIFTGQRKEKTVRLSWFCMCGFICLNAPGWICVCVCKLVVEYSWPRCVKWVMGTTPPTQWRLCVVLCVCVHVDGVRTLGQCPDYAKISFGNSFPLHLSFTTPTLLHPPFLFLSHHLKNC